MPVIAVAGSGDLSRYFSEEFTKYGHEVIILTRREKSVFQTIPNVTQRVTDYTVESLTQALGQSEVLVSAILDYTPSYIDVHLRLIEACKLSPRCKQFIPSEYGGNIEKHPDQPGFYQSHEIVRTALREQKELHWTLVCVGWLIDYIVPEQNRFLRDIGEAFPVNLAERSIVLPGTGREPINVVAARDVAKALAALFKNVPGSAWEPYLYITAEKTTWEDVTEAVQARYPNVKFSFKKKSLDQLLKTLRESGDEDERILAQYQIFSVSHAASFDAEKVSAQRAKYFKDIHFRTVEEVLDETEKNPEVII
ncbi:hypothetical protein BJX68DRAFT_266158 [Aspergillus pseudodeflectus]|uniref:NmrA-like domain-containing protein n=1 Tax=Aspergillus pseudodeflectus TaxID=176178 RepID=A0ABR4KG54_9EURO